MHTLGFVARAVAAAAVLGLLGACSGEHAESEHHEGRLTIRGAGATFPKPLYQRWIQEYGRQVPDAAFEYAGVGSGKGIRFFLAGKDPAGEIFEGAPIHFGASDAAMSDAEIAEADAGDGVVLVPATGGMVVLAYNLPGVTELKLSREALLGIFMGQIKRWDDPAIAASNPDLDLPGSTISPVVRLDSSGTTFIFASHLAAVSPEWRDGPGVGKKLDWPGSAMQVNYNSGVAQRIKVSEGAIGYTEYEFAERLGLPVAALENQAGGFVKPSPAAGTAALRSAPEVPDDLRVFVPDPPGSAAYPIVTYTWLLLRGRYADAALRDALKGAVLWGLTDGQAIAAKMGYLPLPEEMTTLAKAKVLAIE
jgi:phosphate transport system substrate-binding protein